MNLIIVLSLIVAIIVAIEVTLRRVHKNGKTEERLESAKEVIGAVKQAGDAISVFKSNRAVRDRLLEKYTRK
jgi:flagellar basal body-associated protein FliL